MADGKGCECGAYGESECGCNADWTPQELIDARAEIAWLKQELADAKKWAMSERQQRWAAPTPLTDEERELLTACEKAYEEAACRMDEQQRHEAAACLLRRSLAIRALLERLGGER